MKTTSLRSLRDGQEFYIPSIKTMRNLSLVTLTDTSALVKGEEMRNDHWEPFRNYIAPTVAIVVGRDPEETERLQEKKKRKDKNAKATDGIDQTTGEPKIKGVRGRKAKICTIEFPSGEFTVGALAKKLNVKPHTINNELTKRKNEFKILRTEPNKSGRGKPMRIFIKI